MFVSSILTAKSDCSPMFTVRMNEQNKKMKRIGCGVCKKECHTKLTRAFFALVKLLQQSDCTHWGCQEHDSLDVKKLNRGSTAKRNRAAEVHNLSERVS
jgi:hypothetical protein